MMAKRSKMVTLTLRMLILMGKIALALTVSAITSLLVNASVPSSTAVFGPSVVHAAGAGEDDELPRKGYFGVRLAPLPDEIRAREGLGARAGVLIEAVVPGTAAEAGGIRQGDVLLAVDGESISGVPELMKTVASMTVGQTFEVTLLRAGGRMTLPITLKERPRDRGENFDVLYHHVRSGGARIRTIVTRPHGGGARPVLFLIQGLGPTMVDEPLSGPGPYSRILNEFAGGGYATVRLEKPGIGDSEGGPYADIDFETELDTYRQALVAVRKYSFVDPDNVFIFGHSMGGVFGPIIASEMPVRGVARRETEPGTARRGTAQTSFFESLSIIHAAGPVGGVGIARRCPRPGGRRAVHRAGTFHRPSSTMHPPPTARSPRSTPRTSHPIKVRDPDAIENRAHSQAPRLTQEEESQK